MPSTANFGWGIPTDGADDDAWGGILNDTTFDSIDADVWTIKGTADAAMPKSGGVFTDNIDGTTGRVKINALGSTSGTTDVDLSLGAHVSATIGADTTLHFIGAESNSGYAQYVFLRLTNPGVHALAFSGGTFKMPTAGTPTWTTSGDDMLVFVTEDQGTTYRLVGLRQAVTT